MTFEALDRTSVLPLYYQIQQSLVNQIRTGSRQAGDPVPLEQEITERLGVSRITAQQALKSLHDKGLLTPSAATARSFPRTTRKKHSSSAFVYGRDGRTQAAAKFQSALVRNCGGGRADRWSPAPRYD